MVFHFFLCRLTFSNSFTFCFSKFVTCTHVTMISARVIVICIRAEKLILNRSACESHSLQQDRRESSVDRANIAIEVINDITISVVIRGGERGKQGVPWKRNRIDWYPPQGQRIDNGGALLCKAKRGYLLTRKISRYCLLALHCRTEMLTLILLKLI